MNPQSQLQITAPPVVIDPEATLRETHATCIVPGCNIRFPRTKKNRLYCSFRCQKQMERNRLRDRIAREAAERQASRSDDRMTVGPSEVELNAAAVFMLHGWTPAIGPLIFSPPFPAGWTPPTGVAWEPFEGGTRGRMTLRRKDATDFINEGAKLKVEESALQRYMRMTEAPAVAKVEEKPVVVETAQIPEIASQSLPAVHTEELEEVDLSPEQIQALLDKSTIK